MLAGLTLGASAVLYSGASAVLYSGASAVLYSGASAVLYSLGFGGDSGCSYGQAAQLWAGRIGRIGRAGFWPFVTKYFDLLANPGQGILCAYY